MINTILILCSVVGAAAIAFFCLEIMSEGGPTRKYKLVRDGDGVYRIKQLFAFHLCWKYLDVSDGLSGKKWVACESDASIWSTVDHAKIVFEFLLVGEEVVEETECGVCESIMNAVKGL